MIGTLNVKCAAHNPSFPLEPVFTFVNSAQSFRLLNVPRKIGKWDITKVFVNLNYPDNTIVTKECVLNGSVWVGTVEGCATSGTSENGFVVTASGIDEDGNTVSNYILGAGDLYVQKLDRTISPERIAAKMYFFETQPSAPNKGDTAFVNGTLNVWDGTEWLPVAVASDPSYIEDADGNKIEADRDFIVTDNSKWSVNMDSYGTHVLSQTSIYSWEYVEPEGIEGNKKVVLSYRDSENSWFLEYYQWSFGASTWVIFAYGRDYESPSTATSLEITITGDTSIDCTLIRGITTTDKLALESQIPTKTSDLTNDSEFITSADIITMRDLNDFNVYGDPLSSGDMKFKFKAVGIWGTHQITEGTMTIDPSTPTLAWVWTDGQANCSIEYTDESYVFMYEYLSDGENSFNGQFTLPITEPKWSCEYDDGSFVFTIVSSKGTIATQEWVNEQIGQVLNEQM